MRLPFLAQVPAAHRGGMHLVPASTPVDSVGDPGLGLGTFLLAVGACSLALGAVLGCLVAALAWWCCRGAPANDIPLLCRTAERWERLAKKAIFFTGRRRRLSLAVGAYRYSDLRNSEKSKPNQARARRRRQGTQGPSPLREGPAIPHRSHGSDGSGTGGHRGLGRS